MSRRERSTLLQWVSHSCAVREVLVRGREREPIVYVVKEDNPHYWRVLFPIEGTLRVDCWREDNPFCWIS